MSTETEFVSDALRFLEEIGADTAGVDPGTNLFESGVLDSLGTLAFLDFLEQQMGEEIEIEGWTSTRSRPCAAPTGSSRARSADPTRTVGHDQGRADAARRCDANRRTAPAAPASRAGGPHPRTGVRP